MEAPYSHPTRPCRTTSYYKVTNVAIIVQTASNELQLYYYISSRPWAVLVVFRLLHHHVVVGRVPAFQRSVPGSIPSGVRNFNSYLGTGCLCFICVVPCVVSGDGPAIVLTTNSGRLAIVVLSIFLVLNLLLPLKASDPRGCNTLGESKKTEKGRKKERIKSNRLACDKNVQVRTNKR